MLYPLEAGYRLYAARRARPNLRARRCPPTFAPNRAGSLAAGTDSADPTRARITAAEADRIQALQSARRLRT